MPGSTGLLEHRLLDFSCKRVLPGLFVPVAKKQTWILRTGGWIVSPSFRFVCDEVDIVFLFNFFVVQELRVSVWTVFDSVLFYVFHSCGLEPDIEDRTSDTKYKQETYYKYHQPYRLSLA